MGNGKWGTEIWIWGPPDTAGERLLPRETSGRLLGEVRRTSSEPSGAVDTSLGLSDKQQWEL